VTTIAPAHAALACIFCFSASAFCPLGAQLARRRALRGLSSSPLRSSTVHDHSALNAGRKALVSAGSFPGRSHSADRLISELARAHQHRQRAPLFARAFGGFRLTSAYLSASLSFSLCIFPCASRDDLADDLSAASATRRVHQSSAKRKNNFIERYCELFREHITIITPHVLDLVSHICVFSRLRTHLTPAPVVESFDFSSSILLPRSELRARTSRSALILSPRESDRMRSEGRFLPQ